MSTSFAAMEWDSVASEVMVRRIGRAHDHHHRWTWVQSARLRNYSSVAFHAPVMYHLPWIEYAVPSVTAEHLAAVAVAETAALAYAERASTVDAARHA